MTEAEWNASTNLWKLLEYLREKVSDRKLRLFAVACCQRPYYRVEDARHQSAVKLAERLADEIVDEQEWTLVHNNAYALWQEAWATSMAAQNRAPRGTREVERLMDADMATAAGWVILEDAWEGAYQVTGIEWDEKYADEPVCQTAILRDIFGPLPFRRVAIVPTWLSPTVKALASAIYTDRAFDRLPILEDAGCTDADILNHCRQPGEHVRGCWVVDLILGKS